MSEPAEARKARRLAAIAFTDVVSYSAHMQVDEPGTLALVQSDFEAMRALCARHGGQVLKSTGDGLLMYFDSVADAVACALDIQSRFAGRGDGALRHRIGVHFGDVYHQNDDIAGDGVNIAARLQTAARPGTVCVSDAVFAAVKGKVAMESAPLKPLALKNIAQPVAATLIAPPGTALEGFRPASAARRRMLAFAAVLALVAAGAGLILSRMTPMAVPSGAAAFPRDPDLKRARKLIYDLDSMLEDYRLADDIVKPLLAARPNDPEVVTVAAEIAQWFITRGFDTAEPRRLQAQRLTERAVLLAPDNPAALGALGANLAGARTQLGRAEDALRRAIALNPDESRLYQLLYGVLVQTKPGEAEAFAAQMLARFPKEPLVNYDMALHYTALNDLTRAEEWVDKTLALWPLSNALTFKARLRLEWHGDVEGAKLWLDRVPDRQRNNARMVNGYAALALVSGQTGPALRLLDSVAEPWLIELNFIFPRTLIAGDLAHLDGREDIARLQYEAALKDIASARASTPSDLRPVRPELWALMGLGRRDEALAALRAVLQLERRPYQQSMYSMWWFSAPRAALILGERGQALPLLKEACEDPAGCRLLRNLFRVDPKMAPVRDDPAIRALLAEPRTETPATLPARK